MQTYRYNAETKEYLYAEEAFLDPLETEAAGTPVYLLPADSTFTEPLTAKKGYAVCWNGSAWEYIEDHRQKQDRKLQRRYVKVSSQRRRLLKSLRKQRQKTGIAFLRKTSLVSWPR
jgi:hypothetical protein